MQRRGIATGQPTPAAVLKQGRAQHAAMVRSRAADTESSPATSSWQPVGPLQVNTSSWNLVTGRVTSLAVDSSDSTGNTLYVGTNGGGIWKSTNAAGSAATFNPLTDDLSVYSSASLTSLSIGAVTVQPGGTGVILAGTGDPSDATDSWYGAGLLRSADGGNTWSLIDETPANGGVVYKFTGNAFAQFAWSTTTPNLVVAAVSQSRYNALLGISNGQSVLGLYYSTDAGATWQLATIEDGANQIVQSPLGMINTGNAATSVVWNPVRRRFYAAIRYHGYYESPDGITFTRLAHQPGTNLTTAMCPVKPYSVGSPACPLFRGELAVQPVTGDLFAVTVDQNDLDQGLWQDACNLTGGACASSTVLFGTKISDTALEASDGTIADGTYSLALAAVPSQEDTLLIAGTADLWRCSLANSCVWRNTTNTQTCAAAQVAPSQHAIEATFGASGLMYFGNDGGLWRTADAVTQPSPPCSSSDAAHFQNLNGGLGSLAEVESFAEDPSTTTTWLAALGNLGTAAPGASQGPWDQVLNGEGDVVAIDPVNPQNWYATSEFGVGINACKEGTACDAEGFGNVAVGEPQVDDDVELIPAPWILDPRNTSSVILGTCRVWRGAANGSGWSDGNLLSGMLDGESGSFCDGNAEIRSLAAGVVAGADPSAEQIYAGMAGFLDGGGLKAGHVFTATVNGASDASTTVWRDAGQSPVTNDALLGSQFDPGGFAISSLYVDPHDTTGQTVYATVQGYLAVPNVEPLLYMSTNGGSQWIDVTSNLPRVPANSVIVDPNDASTVYVALDTGVYYTQDIGSCASAASVCWNVYGTGLPNAPVISLMAYNEGTTEQLRAATYGRGIWQIDLLTAGIARTTAAASPASVTFAGQMTGTSSDAQTITVTDTGPLNLNISTVSVTGDFTETDNCAGQSIAPKGTCQIQVTFSPADAGALDGTITVLANLSGGQLAVPLSGTGLLPPDLALSPASLTFPVTTVGATSAPQSISVSNSGDLPVALTAETVTGDFSISKNTCGASLAGQSTCEVDVVFSPTVSGTRTGTLSVVNALPTQIAQLSGTAQTVATDVVSPLSLTFTDQQVGTTSATQAVSITNNGDQTLTGIAVSLTGSFTLINSCGTTLAGHSSCSVQVGFAPSTTGSSQGALAITDAIHTQTVALSGNGLAPPQLSVAPQAMAFGGVTMNTNSAVQTVTITNAGGYALPSLADAVTTGFNVASNNCPATLALSSSCQIGIVFAPTATGNLSGSLSLTASNLPAATVVGLTGIGLSPGNIVLTPVSVSFPATLIGSTAAAQNVTVANTGGSPVALSSEYVTSDFAISSNNCGASLVAHASCQLAIVFTPSAQGAISGTLSIVDSLGTQTAPLSGTGQSAATDTLSPASLVFGNQQVATTSATQTVILTNSGDQSLTGIAVSSTGGFTVTNACGATLAGHTNCSIQVAFAPASVGPASATLTIADVFRTQTVALSGTALAPPQLSVAPLSMDFGGVTINTSSATQTITLTNVGGYALNTLTAAVTPGFSIASNNCPVTLALTSSCQIGIGFASAATGSLTGSLTLSASNLPAATMVPLTGTGLAPGNIVLTPAGISFPATLIGSTAAAESITVANTGGSPVALSTESVSGDFTISSNGCGIALAAQASCPVTIVFTPSASGARSGTLSIVDSLGIQTAPLSGTGQSAATDTLSPASLAFGNQQMGTTSATQTVTLTNSGDQSLTNITVWSVGSFTLTNNCGTTLAGHSSCSLQAAFAPSAAGAVQGTLAVSDAIRTQTVALTGTGLARPQLSASPFSIDFGGVTINTVSMVQTVTVMNTGGYALSSLAAAITPGFSIASNGCPASLALASSCQIGIAFAPAATGSLSGSLTLSAASLPVATVVALTGTGLAPGSIDITPSALAFPATPVNAAAAAQSVVVANTGGSAVVLTGEKVNGDYAISSNTCTASLAAQASCQISIVFTPTAPGSRSGTLSIADSLGTQTAPLSGTGLSAANDNLTPASLAFGDQEVGTSSAAQAVTLSNSGDQTLTGIAAAVSGDFTLSNNCGATLAGHASCSMLVAYAPDATGTASGTLTVSDALRTQKETLTGTGLAPPQMTSSPSSLSFGSVTINTTSPAQIVTVNNTGGYALVNLAALATAGFGIASNSCPASLAAGSSCQIGIDFAPTAASSLTGILTLSASNLTATSVITLSGTGVTQGNIVLTPVALSFPATLVGSTAAAQTMTVANTGGSPVTLSSENANGDFAISNSGCGASLAAQASCQMAIVFTPSASGARSGTLSVSDSLGTQTAPLSGTGQSAATDTLSSTSLAFGNQQVGTTSATQVLTLTNSGDQTLTNVAVSSKGNFTLNHNCGAAVAGHSSCSMQVAFAPAETGAATGTLTVIDAFRSQTVALAGTGLAPPAISISSSSIDFGSVTVNATSAVSTVTVTNTGGYPIIDLAALVSAGFSVAWNNCTSALALAASCQIGIDFAPAATGSLTGSLTLTASNLSASTLVALTGTGLAPGNIVLSPVSLGFPATLIGSTAAPQSVTVANTGGSPVALSRENATGDFALSSNTCGTSLGAQTTCQMAIVFTPSASGLRSGVLSIADSLGTQTAPLSGTGQTAATDTLSAASFAFGNQQVGTTSTTQTVTLTNSGDQALNGIAVSSTGAFTLTSNCATTLAGHTSCSMLLAFAPAGTGAASGSLTVTDQLRSQTVALSGTGLAPPAISTSPSSFDFGSVTVNTTSSVTSVAVTNAGGYPVIDLAAFVTAGFAITANNCPASLALGASCQIAIDFAPTAASTVTGTLTLNASNLTSSSVVALSGSGVTPGNIVLTPTSLAFAATAIGTASAGQSVDIANTGGTAVTLTSETVSGDFTINANTCSPQLPAQTACEVVIVFKPSAAGPRMGALTVVDGLGTQSASLSGRGETGATDFMAPSSLAFPAQQVGTSSASQNVTLTNSGDEPLTQIAVSASGDFSVENGCGGSLQGHASCAIQVIYAPTLTGAETGVLTVVDELRTQTVALSGSGVAPPGISATPATIDFGGLAVGSTSSPQSVTVTNSGGYPINSLAVSASAGFAIASGNCPATLDIGAACQVGLTFSPAAAGKVAGTLTVSGTNLPRPMLVRLSGVGEDFSILVSGSSSVVVTSGDTTSFSLQLAGLAGSSGTIALACSGMPTNATCSLNPSSLTLTGSASSSATLSIATGVSTSTSELRSPGWKSALPLFACILPLAWIGFRRRTLTWVVVLLLCVSLLIPLGCGVGASSGSGGGGSTGQQHATPPGTYVITVTATMSNIVHSAAISLTVQ